MEINLKSRKTCGPKKVVFSEYEFFIFNKNKIFFEKSINLQRMRYFEKIYKHEKRGDSQSVSSGRRLLLRRG